MPGQVGEGGHTRGFSEYILWDPLSFHLLVRPELMQCKHHRCTGAAHQGLEHSLSLSEGPLNGLSLRRGTRRSTCAQARWVVTSMCAASGSGSQLPPTIALGLPACGLAASLAPPSCKNGCTNIPSSQRISSAHVNSTAIVDVPTAACAGQLAQRHLTAWLRQRLGAAVRADQGRKRMGGTQAVCRQLGLFTNGFIHPDFGTLPTGTGAINLMALPVNEGIIVTATASVLKLFRTPLHPAQLAHECCGLWRGM